MEPKNNLLLVLLFVNLGGLYVLGDNVAPVKLTESMREFNILSPNYPNNAGPGINRTWLVTAPRGNRLRLNCTDLYLSKCDNCMRGVLSISEGDVKSSQLELSNEKSYFRESLENWISVHLTTGLSSEGRLNCIVTIIPKDKNTSSANAMQEKLKKTSCPCGYTNNTNRHARYGNKTVNDFPFSAYIKIKESDAIHCGGTILTQRHVLTLTSCLTKYRKHQLVVVVGSLDVNRGGQTLNIKEWYLHKHFCNLFLENDIGLLLLSKGIQFNNLVGPVCFPTEDYAAKGIKSVRGIDWGFTTVTYKDLQIDRQLENCYVNIYTKYGKFYTNESMEMELHPGSPLVYKDPEVEAYVLAGISGKLTYPCGFKNETHQQIDRFASANTDIYHFYRYWIKENILQSSHCGLQRHLHLLGIAADGTCPKCGKEQETAIHLVAECEAFAVLRFRTLGSDILSTNELKTVEWQKVLDFVRQTNRM